jgi:hypothetical protein
MNDYHLFWEDSEHGDQPFMEIDFIVPPRVGEEIWFRKTDEEKGVILEYIVEIIGVMHVVETEVSDARVQLSVREISCDEPDLDEDDEEEDTPGVHATCPKCSIKFDDVVMG